MEGDGNCVKTVPTQRHSYIPRAVQHILYLPNPIKIIEIFGVQAVGWWMDGQTRQMQEDTSGREFTISCQIIQMKWPAAEVHGCILQTGGWAGWSVARGTNNYYIAHLLANSFLIITASWLFKPLHRHSVGISCCIELRYNETAVSLFRAIVVHWVSVGTNMHIYYIYVQSQLRYQAFVAFVSWLPHQRQCWSPQLSNIVS